MELRTLTQWNSALAYAIDQIGTNEFFPALFSAIGDLVSISYPQVWLYHRDLPPRVLAHRIPEAAIPSQIDDYLEGPYREDPFYQVSMNSPRSTIYRLGRISANLQDSAYYRNYYGHSGTVDELVFLSKLDDGSVINLSVMRLPKQGAYTESEYQLLYALSPSISALIKAHSRNLQFTISYLTQPGIDHQIAQAFKTFGSSILSPRQLEVLELMLKGYSAEVGAERLGIALETYRRHRKNLYKKLDINSQADLFSLFIASLSCVGEAQGNDPLTIYMS
jgi:DNA-binding CsgD family transcriptional regulator